LYEWIGKITSKPKLMRRINTMLKFLPNPLIYIILQMLGNLLYWFGGAQLKKTIVNNMSEILTESTPLQIHQLCRGYYRNGVITLYEILFGVWRMQASNLNNLHVEGEHFLQEALQLGKGAIVYSPHIGNFFYYYLYLSRRYNCLTVGTAASPELKPLYNQFEQMGCMGLDYDQTAPLKMMKLIKSHLANNGVLFILGDFWRPQFPLTLLFGRSTRGPHGAAAIALEQQVPVIPFSGRRTHSFAHQMIFAQPIYLYNNFNRSQRDKAALSLNLHLEQMILQLPEQWFYWFNLHERWEPFIAPEPL
jgi:KDO2-lipid IV(A) lauroyltransferase